MQKTLQIHSIIYLETFLALRYDFSSDCEQILCILSFDM
jgi:hypothetical protein